MRDLTNRVMAVGDMHAEVVDRARAAIGGTALSLPAATRVGPTPCADPDGDLDEEGRYTVTGNWQIPLPAARQRDVLRQLRDDWRDAGREIVDYRELPDGVRTLLTGRDPATGYEYALGSTEPPEAVALTVTSPCVVSPDGRYPG